MTARSWHPAIFDRLHTERADPWAVHSSASERAKYDATITALGAAPVPRVLELGCSIGGLTARLAAQARSLLAIDFSAVALGRARAACAGAAHVRFRQGTIPRDWPREEPPFDAIVLSEILYFLSAPDLAATARAAAAALAPGGRAVVVNWTGPTDTPHTGDAASEGFIAASGLRALHAGRGDTWRLDVLGREP